MRIHLIHGIHSSGVGNTGKLAPYFRDDGFDVFARRYGYAFASPAFLPGFVNWQNQDGSYTATPKPLAQITARIWDAIKAERDRRTQEGGYQAGGKWFHSDTFSRTQQIGLVMLGAGIPAGTMWKTMDGSFIEMTPALAQQVFAAAAAQDLATFAAAEAHKAAMEAAADPAAYDFSGGWPAVFGG